MKITLYSLIAGLRPAGLILGEDHVPAYFVSAGLMLVQPCSGAASIVFENTDSLATARYSPTSTLSGLLMRTATTESQAANSQCCEVEWKIITGLPTGFSRIYSAGFRILETNSRSGNRIPERKLASHTAVSFFRLLRG